MFVQQLYYPALRSQPKGKKLRFNKTEDELLKQSVLRHPELNWTLIASEIPTRTPRQCRERWFNHLSPQVQTNPLSVEEETLLIRLLSQIGNKWVDISKHFPGRTDVFLKNWVKAMQKGRTASSYITAVPSPSSSSTPFDTSVESSVNSSADETEDNSEEELNSYFGKLFENNIFDQPEFEDSSSLFSFHNDSSLSFWEF
jgi:hypothetical protein